jgi:hypothetical protein
MRTLVLRNALIFMLALVLVSVTGCGADSGESDTATGTATSSGDVPAGQEAETPATAETEVSGMSDGFPADVPVHPGTVTGYEPMQVTDTTTVHQLTVESKASFEDVVDWYQNSLPTGWSVGYFEDIDDEGVEAKIALDGGDYTPASPDGLGGGALVGVQADDGTTLIVTTVTVMGTP